MSGRKLLDPTTYICKMRQAKHHIDIRLCLLTYNISTAKINNYQIYFTQFYLELELSKPSNLLD
jgi:hypothetical protein